MTLAEYCKLLGWNGQELATQAGINHHTALKALRGEKVFPHIARKIAEAITRGMKSNKPILPGEIKDLNY